MSRKNCPSQGTLSDFVLGILPIAEQGTVAEHLDVCTECEEKTGQLDGMADAVVSELRRFSASGPDGAAHNLTEAGVVSPAGEMPRMTEPWGEFRIVREIGRGGMGVVCEAYQGSLNRHVAIKFLPEHGNLARFRREAQAAGRLHHTNIVPVFGVGEHQGRHFYVMQFIAGRGLDTVSKEQADDAGKSGRSPARLRAREAARIGVQVADALTYAHGQGVIHRDIKPSNLLLDDQGTVWVNDFGLAKADDQENLTQTGDIMGTLRYMPPEAFEGRADARGDIYALGLTLYELLCFRPAFDENDNKRLIKQVTTSEPARLDRLNRAAPRDLVTIIHKAIERDPARRYVTAGDFASDLRHYLADEPIKARRQTQLDRYVRWSRHNPGTAVLGGALTAVLVLATVASLLAAGYFNRLRLNEAQAASRERNARHDADNEREVARQQREVAQQEREVAQQNLYYAQMHLAQEAWREHRGLKHMRELLTNWLPAGDSPDRRGWEWFYLNSLPYQNLRTLTEGVSSQVPCTVAWHAGSRRLAAGSTDGVIRIWDVDREQTTLTLHGPGPAGAMLSGAGWFAWCPRGDNLAAGFKDNTVHFWETRTGRELGVLPGHKSPVMSVAYSSDGARLAGWGTDGTIKIWEVSSGRMVADKAHPGDVTAGAWSPDDNRLAAGHDDGSVTISGIHAGDEIATLRGHSAIVLNLAWSSDGTQLATTSFDCTVRIWEIASEKTVVGPLRHTHITTSVAWDPNGKRLATGSMDQTVKIWDTATGREELTLRGHVDAVSSLAFGPEGRLASGGNDGSVRIWSSIRDQESSTLPGHAPRATSVSWSPDGKLLASGGDDGKIRIWEPTAHRELRAIKAHDQGKVSQLWGLIRSLAWSPDGKQLASAGLDCTAKVWDVASGTEVFALPAQNGTVWSVAWSRNGKYLAAGSQDGTIRVIEGLNHTPRVHTFKAHDGAVRGLSWSPKEDRLASGGSEGTVKQWDPIRGTELVRMQGHRDWVYSVAWSPDGERLAAYCGDVVSNLVIAWDAKTGEKLATMQGHHDWVDAVVWSPDGSRLASAGFENTVRVWDPVKGEETFVLKGNSGMFHDVSWHPDGAKLAAASSDGQIWIWNASPGFKPESIAFLEELRDTRARKARAELSAELRELGEEHARRGQWKEAASAFAEAYPLQPNAVLGMKLGILLAQIGKNDRYRHHCKALLEQFARTSSNSSADMTLKTCCLLGPGPAGDQAQLARLADVATAGDPAQQWYEWFLMSKGLHEFRAGRIEAALTACRATRRPSGSASGDVNALAATVFAIEGMALHRSGDPSGAHRSLVEANNLIEKGPLFQGGGHFGDSWSDWLVAQVLYREARALLESHQVGPGNGMVPGNTAVK